MEKIILITYDDCRYDYCKIKDGEQEFYFARTGCGGKMQDVILTEQSLQNAIISRNDSGEEEQGIQICSVPAGKLTAYDDAGNKVEPLYYHAAVILKRLGIADFCDCLEKPVSKPDGERILREILGKIAAPENGAMPESVPVLDENPTVCSALKALMLAMGLPMKKEIAGDASGGIISDSAAEIMQSAAEHGLLKTQETGKAVWFGETTQQLAAIGLYRELVYEDMPLCYDELAAILYNLLLLESKEHNLMYKLVKGCPDFKDKLTATYERSLVYPYYEAFGFEVKKAIFKDDNGKEIPSLYLPGANLNHTYINEYTTADDVHFVLCAAYDNLIRKGGRGIPVLYRATDGKTIQLHERMNMRAYGMLVSKQNIVYFVADDKIYAYDIAADKKSVVFSEPEGYELQEIPTISDDGKFLVFFYGTIKNYYPNRGCILNLETGEWKIFLQEDWVDAHFAGTKNPFAGHFILNPKRTNLVNFLHGGGQNVTDRMWLADVETGEIWEPYKQICKEDGTFGEELTHWIWSADGKRLYFVRIQDENFIVESGISYIDLDETPTQVHVMDSQRFYIHMVPDANDHFFICDTHGHENWHWKSEIILVNGDNHKLETMYKLSILKNHPSHPHPQFGVSGKNIIFAYTPDDLGRVAVGVVNVEEEKKRLED